MQVLLVEETHVYIMLVEEFRSGSTMMLTYEIVMLLPFVLPLLYCTYRECGQRQTFVLKGHLIRQ